MEVMQSGDFVGGGSGNQACMQEEPRIPGSMVECFLTVEAGFGEGGMVIATVLIERPSQGIVSENIAPFFQFAPSEIESPRELFSGCCQIKRQGSRIVQMAAFDKTFLHLRRSFRVTQEVQALPESPLPVWQGLVLFGPDKQIECLIHIPPGKENAPFCMKRGPISRNQIERPVCGG